MRKKKPRSWADEPRPDEGPPPEVDADWFSKWRAGAQDVSREEMQRLWAKLLAGEVSKPQTYPLRTEDFLSRMSVADADLLARVAPFVTSGGIVRLDMNFFASKGIPFGDFLYLDDTDVINGTVLRFDLSETAKSPPELSFDIFPATKVGREILSLASFPTDEDYLKAVVDKGIGRGACEVLRGKLHPDGRQILGLHTIAKKEAEPPK